MDESRMSPESLDQLVAVARQGDRAAFRRIVLEVEHDLRFFLAAFEASQGLCDEILQATLVAAYGKLHQYTGRGVFRAWLKAIARNNLMRALREQRRFAEINDDRLSALVAESHLDDLERMEDLEGQTRRLRACMAKLPPPMRGLVEARYERGLSSARLAEELSRTEIWVRVTLCRIRAALRRCMEMAEQRS
jgi:RNA polymerase sigma-70 factor (ECF subfamily)